MMTRDNAPCLLCGDSRREVLIRKDNWHVYRCSSCGLGFLDPLPSEPEIASLYMQDYFADQYDKGVEPDTPDFAKRLRLEGHRIRFFKGLKREGSVLDVGCGNGYFLAACRERGYQATGLDLSEWAVNYVRETLGIACLSGPLDSVDLAGQVFDVITLWHVLEHTRDPRKTIITVGSWLQKNGILVLEVPNYEGTDAQRLREDWVGWQIPYHFYHFTPETLIRLLDVCGFRVIKKKTYHSEVVKQRLQTFPVPRPLARLIARGYSGTGIAVIAVRKGA